MAAKYGNEKSSLKIRQVIFQFPYRHTVNLLKRTFYNYYLREWNVASLQLPLGLGLSIFGLVFGLQSWASASAQGIATSTGQGSASEARPRQPPMERKKCNQSATTPEPRENHVRPLPS
jgi:hypothetical protein